MYQVSFSASDDAGHTTVATAWLQVVLPPVAPVIKSAEVDPEEVENDGKTKVRLVVVVTDDNDDIDSVFTDLTPIKGSPEAQLRNDGKGGDLASGDDTWTLEFTVPTTASTGLKGKIEVFAVDGTELIGAGSFSLRVLQANSPPEITTYSVRTGSGTASNEFAPGSLVVMTVNVTDPDGDILELTINFTELPLTDIPLLDDGESPDAEASDNVHSASFTIPEGTKDGAYNITIYARDPKGSTDQLKVRLYVAKDKGDEGSEKLSPLLLIGVPSLGVVLLLALFVMVFMRRTNAVAKKGRAPQIVQQGYGRAQPPVFQPYVGPR
jgi:hypothetical protein